MPTTVEPGLALAVRQMYNTAALLLILSPPVTSRPSPFSLVRVSKVCASCLFEITELLQPPIVLGMIYRMSSHYVAVEYIHIYNLYIVLLYMYAFGFRLLHIHLSTTPLTD